MLSITKIVRSYFNNCYSIDNYYRFMVLRIMYCYLNNFFIVLLKLWAHVLYIAFVFVLIVL
jgi:hypothetical protein